MNAVRFTKDGIAVIDGDTHTTKWTEEQHRIDTDRAVDKIVAQIPVGGVVVDVGASIGDHTVPYAKKVGATGRVLAFEPNTSAFACLAMNVREYHQVFPMKMALSEREQELSYHVDDYNFGASRIIAKGSERILSVALDDFSPWFEQFKRFDLIKIDCEGYEPNVLDGAAKLLARFKPIIVIEINDRILNSIGKSRHDIFNRAHKLGYDVKPLTGNFMCDQFDAICFPK